MLQYGINIMGNLTRNLLFETRCIISICTGRIASFFQTIHQDVKIFTNIHQGVLFENLCIINPIKKKLPLLGLGLGLGFGHAFVLSKTTNNTNANRKINPIFVIL